MLLSSEPYAFRDKHLAEVSAALPDTRVTLIDGEQVSWYGSRAIEGITYLSDYARRARRSNPGDLYVTADR